MADNIVRIDLGTGSFTDQNGNRATYSGVVNVDYTTGAVDGNFSVTRPSATGNGTYTVGATFSQSSLGRNGNNMYTANNGGNTPFFQIQYTGQAPTAADVQFVDNGAGQRFDTANNPAGQQTQPTMSTVTSGSVCFTTGTRIRTSRGDTAVEDLAVGDLVVTASGDLRPIGWIGHRHLDGCGGALPHDQQPIRIRRGAFGQSAPGVLVPSRALVLSPGHPVLVGAGADGEGGHLVPAMCLVNGTTIERVALDSVTYWHVELDAHDILLAEGLPAESYLDWGDRAFFSESADHALANPDFVVPGLERRCRPVAVEGPVVEAERQRLDQVFATTLTAQSGWSDGAAVSLPSAWA